MSTVTDSTDRDAGYRWEAIKRRVQYERRLLTRIRRWVARGLCRLAVWVTP